MRILKEYDEAVTIRHLFYRLEAAGVISKDEKACNNLIFHLGKWRISGRIPFNRFVDGTRWHYGIETFDDAADAMQEATRSYRRNLWRDQHYYVEIWCEKEAIASLVKPVADDWALKTFICRGFNSLSASFSAAEQFLAALKNGKQPVILYLGDHDPSGRCIDQSIMKHFRYFDVTTEDAAYGAHGMRRATVADCVNWLRVAIEPEQIVEFNLPTRPVKETDTRAKGWIGGCVEIDTLTGRQIRDLLESHITDYIDRDAWERRKLIEKAERDTLSNIMHLHRRELEDLE